MNIPFFPRTFITSLSSSLGVREVASPFSKAHFCSTASRNTTREPVRLRETTYGHSDVDIHALLETVDNLKRNRLTDEDITPKRVPFHFPIGEDLSQSNNLENI